MGYFQEYYIERNYGPGYVATNITYVVAVVLLLNSIGQGRTAHLRKMGEIALCWLGTVFYCSIYWLVFGHAGMDRSMMLLFLGFYAVFRSKYKPVTRLVRSCVFFSCMMLMLPISEPVGKLIENNINGEYTWAEHLTSLIVVVLTVLVMIFLKRFSTEMLTFIPAFSVMIVAGVSVLCVLLVVASEYFGVSQGYTFLLSGCFLGLMPVMYYMFYRVSREYERNLELVAIRHKEELEEEMLQFARDNYEEMHQIRHEIKNHMAYIRVLADLGEYGKLKEYLTVVNKETEEHLQFIECGNDVINAVMNHAIRQAKGCGVQIECQIVVPPSLPYKETELCSLLSNMMENAIEAAVQSGRECPLVSVSILPRQDYLFLHVVNPVSDSIPAQRRLSLRTTKEDKVIHGYGTKIIRRIAERYDGSVMLDIRDGCFIADVMLYLGEAEKDGESVSGGL